MARQQIQTPQQPFYNFFGYQSFLQLKKKKKSSSHTKKNDEKHRKSSKWQKKLEKGDFEIKNFKYNFGDYFGGQQSTMLIRPRNSTVSNTPGPVQYTPTDCR